MKRTLIAAAVLAAASGSVFAHGWKDPYIFDASSVSEDVDIHGWVTLFGGVHVSSTAGAVVNNTQDVMADTTLDPNAQSYTSGSVTTTINNNRSSVRGGGIAFADVTRTHSSSSVSAQGYEESSGYTYGNERSSVSGGGYEYSQQSAGIEGSFSHQSQNAGGHISAGGSAGGSYNYAVDNDPGHGHGSFHTQGGFSAGYSESGYRNSSQVAGGFEATQGSGQGARWNFHADQGSGHQAFAEQSGGYSESASRSTDGFAAAWGVDSSLATTDVTTTGSITRHIDTQTPGNLTATTGSGAADGVSGNIGVNITEGIDNAQSNDASLASVDAGNVFGNAEIFNDQSSAGHAHVHNFNLNASVGDNSLQGASGNVGVNVASGIGNVQNNSLAASTTTMAPGDDVDTVAMVATDQTSQSAHMHFNGSFEGTAMLGSDALDNASGNIGVNIAGGVGNVQHNGLAIAAMNLSGR
ncbi:hypothetical protein P3T23_008914 [Paraburkholderia sp. GAS448]|uniref:hypothetical protein n=1 Tax=Paraburkholderia sp. GAS448 TaxID=3035136 RepID=UPI003D207D36